MTRPILWDRPGPALVAGILALLLQAHPEQRPNGMSSDTVALRWALLALL